jgi:prepilin peptidase CpaA
VFQAWSSALLPYIGVACVLIVVGAALHDVAARTVPNTIPFILAALGAIARTIEGSLIVGLGAAIVVFVVALLCWSRGWVGGGDVKLLGATALAVPPDSVPMLVFVMGMAGGLLSLFYLSARRIVPAPTATRPQSLIARVLRAERWRIRRGGPLPYACAIAAGGLFVLL